MKKIYIFFIFTYSACLLFFSWADDTADIYSKLAEIIPISYADELVSNGGIRIASYKTDDYAYKLIPNTVLGNEIIRIMSTPSIFCSETLYLYKKESANINIPFISSVLRSISTLTGLQYFSPSRNKYRDLYTDVYVIDNAVDKNRLPDPVDGNADGLEVLAFQEDLTFGKNLYQYTYRETEKETGFYSKNATQMKWGFLRILDEGNLNISLSICELDEYLLIYALINADFFSVPTFFENKIMNSFNARVDAIYSWFIRRLADASAN